jgi:hypothetical protein
LQSLLKISKWGYKSNNQFKYITWNSQYWHRQE